MSLDTSCEVKGNFIGGKWRQGVAGITFEKRSPSNLDDIIGVFPDSNSKDAEQAVEAARKAFPAWRSLSLITRGEFIDRFTQIVKADLEGLARLMAREMGKSINECRADVTEGIHMAQHFFGRARMPYGDVVSSEIAEKDSFMLRHPKGVVAVIAPWNFPFAIPVWLVIPSLFAGNTVVFKPAEDTPLSGQKLVEYFEQAGLPAGALNLIQGEGSRAGWPLVVHPEVEVILFTGSYEVGAKIKEAVAKDWRKMAACEMGGKNAIIVFNDANLEMAANACVISAFKTSGQRCTAASRLLVQDNILKAFTARFLELAERVNIGDPLDAKTFMGPVINQAAVDKILSYNELAVKEGARVLKKGGRLKGGIYDKGYFLSPFIYTMEHNPDSRVLREEVFGPHAAIIPFHSIDDAIRIHNDCDYGLSMSVITEDYRKAARVRDECQYGVGYHNLPCIGAEVHLPFGGVKKSGTGLPSATTLLDVVSHRTAWSVNNAQEIKLAQGLSAKIE